LAFRAPLQPTTFVGNHRSHLDLATLFMTLLSIPEFGSLQLRVYESSAD